MPTFKENDPNFTVRNPKWFLVEHVKAEFKKARIQKKNDITQEKVKSYLKKLGYNRYYEHTRQLTSAMVNFLPLLGGPLVVFFLAGAGEALGFELMVDGPTGSALAAGPPALMTDVDLTSAVLGCERAPTTHSYGYASDYKKYLE